MTKTTEKPYPLGPHIFIAQYKGAPSVACQGKTIESPTRVAYIRSLESRDGAMVRALASLQCVGWVLLLVLVLAPRTFLRVLRFSSLHKNQHSKFQFNQNRRPARKPAKADVASSLHIVIYVFIYLFIYLFIYSFIYLFIYLFI